MSNEQSKVTIVKFQDFHGSMKERRQPVKEEHGLLLGVKKVGDQPVQRGCRGLKSGQPLCQL